MLNTDAKYLCWILILKTDTSNTDTKYWCSGTCAADWSCSLTRWRTSTRGEASASRPHPQYHPFSLLTQNQVSWKCVFVCLCAIVFVSSTLYSNSDSGEANAMMMMMTLDKMALMLMRIQAVLRQISLPSVLRPDEIFYPHPPHLVQ